MASLGNPQKPPLGVGGLTAIHLFSISLDKEAMQGVCRGEGGGDVSNYGGQKCHASRAAGSAWRGLTGLLTLVKKKCKENLYGSAGRGERLRENPRVLINDRTFPYKESRECRDAA